MTKTDSRQRQTDGDTDKRQTATETHNRDDQWQEAIGRDRQEDRQMGKGEERGRNGGTWSLGRETTNRECECKGRRQSCRMGTHKQERN